MKGKEKNILAIAEDLSNCLEYDIEDSDVVDTYDTAYKLANKGWVKLPQDGVVLSQSEYVNDFNSQFNKGYRMGCKEMAERYKVAMMLCIQEMQKYLEITEEQAKILYHHNSEIAKQFGIEIKE